MVLLAYRFQLIKAGQSCQRLITVSPTCCFQILWMARRTDRVRGKGKWTVARIEAVYQVSHRRWPPTSARNTSKLVVVALTDV